MKSRRIVPLIAAALLVLTGVAIAAPSNGKVVRAEGAELAAGRYVVVLEDSAVAGTVAAAQAATFGFDVLHVYSHTLQGYAAKMPASVAQAVAALPGVKWVEQDRIFRATAQSLPSGIDRVDADLSTTAGINNVDTRVNVDVAVIDTGVDLNHPDLNVYTAGQKNCTFFGLFANADDDNGHGSHVAGTIGALDNNDGVVGVAPGARIWPVKVLNAAGVGFGSDIICGIDYVASRSSEIEVANMSLGGGGTDRGACGAGGDSQHAAICDAVNSGVTFVVAAGNDSSDAAGFTPAAYDEVITVSALADFNGQPGGGAPSTCTADVDDTFANFSNYGADVDIIAPGVCINSTVPGGGYDNTYSGTSMASPHVAGGAALYKAVNPSATPAQVRAALIAAGTLNWNSSDDPDGVQERLLNVASF
ncbi:MAG: S8 family serine peptidase [Actinobacteria bacterium]|nr:S8 family serine peptidase [Actinomycetota bacterium]